MSNPFKRIGPTGKFPYGKLHESDEGELAMGIAIDSQNNVIVLNFGKPILWTALPASKARELAQILIEKANELDKKLT